MSQTTHGVVVGVTGTGQDTAALQWAARRAHLTGSRVTLVHAYGHVLPPPPPSVALTAEPMAEAAAYLIGGCVERYLHLAPEDVDKPETLVDPGRPAHVLTELSREADLVVLSHHDPSHRIHTGSTTNVVAAHAQCSTVAVPASWSPAERPDAQWVTVGVHETGTPDAVLEAAAREAELAGAPMRLVHGWRLDTVYDDIISARIDPEWRERSEQAMARAAQTLLTRHPGLRIEVRAVHEWPADALASLAHTSRLLVVGRHEHRRPMPRRLGSVARTAIRTSSCPVMVVPVETS